MGGVGWLVTVVTLNACNSFLINCLALFLELLFIKNSLLRVC